MEEQQKFMASMLVSMLEAREREADRVSRLLHDEVGQVLSAVGLQLSVLRLDLQAKTPEIVERTAEIQAMLEQAVTQVRDLSYELNPAVVEKAGLHFALERLLGRLRTGYAGSLRLLYDAPTRVTAGVGNTILKMVELAVDNAIKHAAASEIQVVVKANDAAFTAEVRDNGVGFDPQAQRPPQSLGLLLLQAYADRSALKVSVRSSSGRGTTIKISSPRPGTAQTSSETYVGTSSL